MKLYLKEKVFTLTDRFTVWDAMGQEKYHVEGEFFSLGKQLHIYDFQGQEVASIHQELFTLLPRYQLVVRGRPLGYIRKKWSFFSPRYTVEELGWEIQGHFLEHDFAIFCQGRQIASIEKEWMSWGDQYVLTIDSKDMELAALAVVLTIDCVAETQNNG